MRYIPLSLFAVLVIGINNNLEACPGLCCGGGPVDRISVTLIDMAPTVPGQGYIQIGVDLYVTLEDDCDATLEYVIERTCRTEDASWRDASKGGMCAIICGNPSECPEGIVCFECPRVFSHSCAYFTRTHNLTDKGTFKVIFKGAVVFSQEFDYSTEPGIFEMKFTDIEFLNKDYRVIIYDDVFDAKESVGLRVGATYSGNEPIPAVIAVFKSTLMLGDSLMVSVPLYDYAWGHAYYATVLPEGAFLSLVGDPEESLPPYTTAEIIAHPIPFYCNDEVPPDVPEDRLTIANFLLRVKEISFIDDYEIYKDGPSPSPNDPPSAIKIEDPIWVDGRTVNDPAAYRRFSGPRMNVVLSNSHLAKHDFKYWIKGIGWGEQQRYSTEICEGHFNYSMRDTIFNVVPDDGRFPDSVGIINPLTYKWFANKIVYGDPLNYNYLNDTSTKIYLTYEQPLEGQPRVIALDKICVYAQDLNKPDSIAYKGVSGIYNEAWDYNPSQPYIFADPLDVIRKRTGLCADYANLMTCLFRTIGIPANSVIIYNGATFGATSYWLYWTYSVDFSLTCLLSKRLTSCDNESKEWAFRYHATSLAVDLLCDAALGITAPKSKYAEWWRYYLYPRNPDPPYSRTSPPPEAPTYYDWPLYIPTDRVLPTDIMDYEALFVYP